MPVQKQYRVSDQQFQAITSATSATALANQLMALAREPITEQVRETQERVWRDLRNLADNNTETLVDECTPLTPLPKRTRKPKASSTNGELIPTNTQPAA